MANLRKSLKAVSGADRSGNDVTLQETDIQPYIDNPEMAQMEADVTKARYGGSAIQDAPGGPPGPAGEAPYAQPGGQPGAAPDFSRRNDFESHVFNQLKSETIPTGNPFEFNPVATMNALSKQDLPMLFERVFQNEVAWEDRHLLDDDQKKYWMQKVKGYRAHLKNSLNAERETAISAYNQMMNQFDNAAKEHQAAMKVVQARTDKFMKNKAAKSKDAAAALTRRTAILTKIRELTQKVFDDSQARTMSDAEKSAYNNELQGLRTELQQVSQQAGIIKRKPKIQTASAKGKKTPAGKTEKDKAGRTIVRKKVPGQGGGKKTIVKTGTVKSGPNKGRKKIMYEDGSTAYADEIK